ncbi:MAG: penicillin-binding transpeptidase domain-containing protein [Saprospiraceae bacterium]
MAADLHKDNAKIIQIFFILCALVLLGQLLNLQVFNKEFKIRAEAAGSSRLTEYPSRGLIFDRNNQLMVVNRPVYDLMFIYNQFEANAAQFDTTKFCKLLGVTKEYFIASLDKNWKDPRYSKAKAEPFLTRITQEQHAAFQESLYQFPGFYIEERNARAYPHQHAAHLLGYIGEVNNKILEDSTDIYSSGDYLGVTGMEKYYEYYLRGIKGIRRVEKDIRGRIIGSVADGQLDVDPVAGYDLFSTIDMDLQQYAEELMQNKIGSIVAIEPSTGEILALVSSPNYDPNSLAIGSGRGQRYAELANDTLQPLLNRCVQGQYPPGSLFKPIVALIGLQLGTLSPERGVSCGGAYYFNGMRLTGCHGHAYCGSVSAGIQHSCNAYFVTVFREIIDRHKDESTPRKGLDEFNSYLERFGMGHTLGVDFPGELKGNIPSSAYYDKVYAKESGWKSIWIRSLGIGQGNYWSQTCTWPIWPLP